MYIRLKSAVGLAQTVAQASDAVVDLGDGHLVQPR